MAMTGFLVSKAATAALRHSTGSKKRPEKSKRSRLPAGRALLLGAGLMTGGRWLLHGRGGHITETVQQWVDEVVEELEDDGQPDDEEEDEELEGDEDFDEGAPGGEGDEDFDEEPEADAEAPLEEEEGIPADAE